MESSLETLGLMDKVVSLCKRRGFIFQSSEIYGGLKSCYDYGPLGVELKRNISSAWWRDMVYARENVVGLDASIMMHPKVWEASGHLSGFSDPLVDCLNCKERFRADKAPRLEAGSLVTYAEGGKSGGKKIEATVDIRGYVCPVCGSPKLSDERQFNLMFRTGLGPVDPVDGFLREIKNQAADLSLAQMREKWDEAVKKTAVYLRPETAQAMFVQFLNVQQSLSMKVPFGIAQMGKSFRNEIITEHYIFRSCEFEQMEMEFFCEPGTQKQWLDYWKQERMAWYHRYANDPNKFKFRQHASDELAHYSDDCYDIEYAYPWGWGELEGIASRTDYDLKKHTEHSGVKLSYFDQQKPDPATGKMGWRYTPYVIEPAAGLTRSVLCFLLDSFCEEAVPGPAPQDAEAAAASSSPASEGTRTRTVLKLHPALAPIKTAILPLVKKDGQPELAEKIAATMRAQGINVSLDAQQSIGKRYARHDEIGTPFCVTIDPQSILDQTVTVRDRNTCQQERLPIDVAIGKIKNLVMVS